MKTILGILILFAGFLAIAFIPHLLGAMLTKGFPYFDKDKRFICWVIGTVVIGITYFVILFGYCIGRLL